MNSSRLGFSAVGWLALACLPAALAHAQLAEPAERTQRLADEPLRRIVEAGKLKSRSKPIEAEPPARGVATKPGTRSGSDGNGSNNKPIVTKPRPVAVVTTATAAAAVASVAASAPASVPVVQASAPEPAALQELAAPAAAVALPPLAPLELEAGGEPVLPEEIGRQLDADAEVVLQCTVNADGSVSDVSVRSSSNPIIEPAALALVTAWRFKPIGQSRVHTVQLVFHRPD